MLSLRKLVKLSTNMGLRSMASSNSVSYNARIDASKLKITKTTKPKLKAPYETLVFGRTFSDHMLVVDWDSSNGWHAPEIIPYGDLTISPAATCLHYGIECFEGMKAYKNSKGEVSLFRPDKNMERFNFSMKRLAMPTFNEDGLTECLKTLLRLDESWVPDQEGYSIYIRPTAIGTSPALGVHASDHVKLYIIMCPVGPYYKTRDPVKLYADTTNVRAWPGGVGNAKVGGNYGPTIDPSREAAKLGCQQILWLFGPNHEATEVGAMNIFFVLRRPKSLGGGVELVTGPLTRGDILPGVTRRSVLDIAEGWSASENPLASSEGPLTVSERWVTMGELLQAQAEGRLLESFCAGTAAVIHPVKAILYNGSDITFPTGQSSGVLTSKFYKVLSEIQYGHISPHPWAVKV